MKNNRILSVLMAVMLLISVIPFGGISALADTEYDIFNDGNCHVINEQFQTVDKAAEKTWLCATINDSLPAGKYATGEIKANEADVHFDDNYNFEMPAHSITISAVIKDKQNYTIDLSSRSASVPAKLIDYLGKVAALKVSGTNEEYDFNGDGTGEATVDLVNNKITVKNTVELSSLKNFTITFNDPLNEYYNVTFSFTGPDSNGFNVTWQDDNNKLLQVDEKVPSGDTVTYTGVTPQKAQNAQYRYEYSGWTDGTNNYAKDAVITVYKDMTLTATFNEIPRDSFSVIWRNYDGTVLQRNDNCPKDTTPAYTGATPTRPSDKNYKYTFKCWSPEVTAITKDTVYTATYIAEEIKTGTSGTTTTVNVQPASTKTNKTSAAKIRLVLKTVTVKKSAKKLVLQATLTNNKKPIKGKTVRFKFNGKMYKAKTNKKGVAKVTIKKSVLKKLKAGKKIKYSASYAKTTITKTAKVKK